MIRNIGRFWQAARAPRPERFSLARWVGRGLSQISYAVLVEPTWLEINRFVIPVAGLTGQTRLRVLQMTDFHFQRAVKQSYIESCIESANAENPDLIALTGDFIHRGPRYVSAIAEMLAALRAPLGVFAVLGNHDYAVRNALGVRTYPKLNQQVADALARNNIRVLRNELVALPHAGTQFQLSGVDDLWSRECQPQKIACQLDPQAPHIMLAHHPRTIELIPDVRCDLMLSGHTHGGQVHLQRLGSVILSKKMKEYAAGMYPIGGQLLYVNKGVGFGVQIRYNRRPEIAVFDLVAPLKDEAVELPLPQ